MASDTYLGRVQLIALYIIMLDSVHVYRLFGIGLDEKNLFICMFVE